MSDVRREDAPEGTIMPLLPGKERYLVRGKGGWYECDADEGTCDCPHYRHRLAGKRELCKHLRWLAIALKNQRDCPACQGLGVWVPRLEYVDRDGRRNRDPIPCVLCDGSGRRENCDVDLLEQWQERQPETEQQADRDVELKRLFA